MRVEDVEAIAALPLVRSASPEFIERLPVAYGDRQAVHAIRGVNTRLRRDARTSARRPDQGRFIDDCDVEERRRVAFLGREVYRKLFGGRPAVGETMRIAGRPFEVIGVMDDKVQMSSYFSPDAYCVFIPWTTMGQLGDVQYLDTLVFQSVDALQQPQAIRQVREELGRRLRFNPADERALTINDSVENTRAISSITNGLKVVLDLHRRADAGDRRRRHHEHHVRVGEGAHARDRHPQGARARAGARFSGSSCSRGWSSRSSAAASAC